MGSRLRTMSGVAGGQHNKPPRQARTAAANGSVLFLRAFQGIQSSLCTRHSSGTNKPWRDVEADVWYLSWTWTMLIRKLLTKKLRADCSHSLISFSDRQQNCNKKSNVGRRNCKENYAQADSDVWWPLQLFRNVSYMFRCIPRAIPQHHAYPSSIGILFA
jgi:hypothetical protein